MNIYELYIEVRPLKGCEMPHEIVGAFLYVFVPAASLEQSIEKMKIVIQEDHYRLLDIDYVSRIDLAEWQTEDENLPTEQDLINILQNEQVIYSVAFAYEAGQTH